MSTAESSITTQEIELRVYDIDKVKIRNALRKLGAVSVGTFNFKRAVMDVIPQDPNKWIRVRTTKSGTTVAIKERSVTPSGYDKEVEIEVADFDKALELLEKLNGYRPRSIQENIREQYELGGVEVCLDTWPILGDILELEAPDFEHAHLLTEVAKKLGVEQELLTSVPVEIKYAERGIDVKNTDIRF